MPDFISQYQTFIVITLVIIWGLLGFIQALLDDENILDRLSIPVLVFWWVTRGPLLWIFYGIFLAKKGGR